MISFVLIAAVVYFLIVLPYTKAKERFFPAEERARPPTSPCSRRSATCSRPARSDAAGYPVTGIPLRGLNPWK